MQHLQSFPAHLAKFKDASVKSVCAQFAPPSAWVDGKGDVVPDLAGVRFWDLVSTNAKAYNAEQAKKGEYHRRRLDLRLGDDALGKLRANGFVVGGFAEGAGAGVDSFGEAFNQIYSDDLPVFVSADAVLHAWHRSFDDIVKELEQSLLSPVLTATLAAAHRQLPSVLETARARGGAYEAAVRDADVFLAVARSLLNPPPPPPPPSPESARHRLAWFGIEEEEVDGEGPTVGSVLGSEEDARIADLLGLIRAQATTSLHLFGTARHTDFSQFKPRGHYEETPTLKRFFRCMMWCGRVDLRIAGAKHTSQAGTTRQLAAALVLVESLRTSGVLTQWTDYDRLLQAFFGQSDSCTCAQLVEAAMDFSRSEGGGGDGGGDKGASCLVQEERLEAFQEHILRLGIGQQGIAGEVYEGNDAPGKPAELPASFALVGQRFSVDSWVLGNIVFDRVEHKGKKVVHRHPGFEDVAFGVFANNAATPLVQEKVQGQGLPYHCNLAAARCAVDDQPEEAWGASVVGMWLRLLRELSKPPSDNPAYPKAMRTRAWAHKDMESQAASWAQLRHDSVLHIKQSYGFMLCCEYPAGFVDPRVHFWEAFERMVARARDLIRNAPLPPSGRTRRAPKALGRVASRVRVAVGNKRGSVQSVLVGFLDKFLAHLGMLKAIAAAETAHQPLTDEQAVFVKRVCRVMHGGSGSPTYDGWYFDLFFNANTDAMKPDLIVSDVHTNPRDEFDPGSVLHEGLAHPALMLIVVDSDEHSAVYVGPVFTHHEFETPADQRLSDSEWATKLASKSMPKGKAVWKDTFRAASPGGNVMDALRSKLGL